MRVDTAQNDGASICPRSLSASSHSFASNPKFAPLVALPRDLRPFGIAHLLV